MSWAIRLKAKMQELGITQEELASKVGMTRGSITHYIAGRRIPPLEKFSKLASALQTDPAWLQYGASSKFNKKSSGQNQFVPPSLHLIPILSWQQIAEVPDVSKLKKNKIQEWLPHFYTDNKKWYALRIQSDSMFSPEGLKNFQQNDIIVIDPDKHESNGCFVIAYLTKSKEVTFRQYVVYNKVKYLKPLNPHYALVPIDKNIKICGVIVSSIHGNL